MNTMNSNNSTNSINSINPKNSGILWLAGFGLITIILWQTPFGRTILYPFTLLGTWFHEMGHGLMVLILGGNFIRLEIFPDGSGLAVHSGSLFLGRIGSAMVAGAGPIGPTIAGSIFILASRKVRSARVMLFILSIFMILSDIIWVRSWTGFLLILLFGLLIFFIALKASDKFQSISLQFLGIQSFISLYLSIGYLFSQGGVIEGRQFLSDTEVIAQNLFLPYWFWGGSILLLSVYLIFKSVRSAVKQS
jgi:hypothetical protein